MSNSELAISQKEVINNSIELFRTAPEILQSSQKRSSKAIAVGRSILEQWNAAWQIENEEERLKALSLVDERSNNYLVNCNKALKEEKETRAAITQMMDEFKKMFTNAENDIDKSKPNTVPSKIQSNRNTYAQEVAKIAEQKRKAAELKEKQDKEIIDIRAAIELQLNSYFQEYLTSRKLKFTDKFNSLKLDGFADDAADLRLYNPEYKIAHFSEFKPQVFPRYVSNDQVTEILASVKESLFETFIEKYVSEMRALKNDIIDKIPSKLEELKEQKRLADEAAEAKRRADEAAKNAKDEEEKKRLKDLADKAEADKKLADDARIEREKIDAARIAKEAEESQKQAELEIEMRKQGEQTMAMFEKEATIAETVPQIESKVSLEIEILHPAAFVQIFQLWFENEGKKMPIDKIGNTKMSQMVAWAEKNATKGGEKIVSKFLNYKDSFKAVNRK